MFFRITDLYFSVRRRGGERWQAAPEGAQPGRRGRGRPVLFDQDAVEPEVRPAAGGDLRPAAGGDLRRLSPGAPYAWDGVATPGEIGRPGDLPVPVGQQLRRWGALLALAGLALPGVSGARLAVGGPPAVPIIDASRTGRPEGSAVSRDAGSDDGNDVASGMGAPGDLPNGAAWEDTAPAAAAPWEAGMVEADGKPLPTAPPPGPVPVDGIPQPAGAASATTDTTMPVPATPKADPAPGETVRSVPNQSAGSAAPRPNDIVPDDREYLRPILVRYAQENGL